MDSADSEPARAPLTALVVDDDRDIRELVALKLRQAGFDVRTSGDGADALTQLRAAPPDIAVLDVMMPGLSGLDIARQVREDPATARVPIILLTAKSQEFDVEAGFALGVDDYIIKPFSPREFVHRVNAVLSRSRA
jgi:DNA-binding response OmpR family regulator